MGHELNLTRELSLIGVTTLASRLVKMRAQMTKSPPAMLDAVFDDVGKGDDLLALRGKSLDRMHTHGADFAEMLR
jgi:hypothetical protein